MEESERAERIERLVDAVAGAMRDDMGAEGLRALRDLALLASEVRRCPHCGRES
jgi:hypothetical protein